MVICQGHITRSYNKVICQGHVSMAYVKVTTADSHVTLERPEWRDEDVESKVELLSTNQQRVVDVARYHVGVLSGRSGEAASGRAGQVGKRASGLWATSVQASGKWKTASRDTSASSNVLAIWTSTNYTLAGVYVSLITCRGARMCFRIDFLGNKFLVDFLSHFCCAPPHPPPPPRPPAACCAACNSLTVSIPPPGAVCMKHQ